MVPYFELSKTGICVQDRGRVVLGGLQQNEVDKTWSEIVIKNPSAFNGGVWTCLGYSANGREVSLGVAQTDYSTATTARINKWNNGLTMGTGVMVFEDNDLVLARRTNMVVSDPGKISMAAGGVLDTKTQVKSGDFLGMAVTQMENELEEELKFKRKCGVIPVGLAIGPGNKAEWLGVVFVNGPKIKDKNEAVKLIKVPRRNLVEFVGDNRPNLELSTLWHLEYWAERIAKTEGLDFLK